MSMEMRTMTAEESEERMLRDHFAGLAMQGMVKVEGENRVPNPEQVARLAYRFAEAMIGERKDPKKN